MPWDFDAWDSGFWDSDASLSPLIPTQARKKHTMPKKPFMPAGDAAKQPWLNNFVDKLMDATKGYAAKYSIPAATVTALDSGRKWVNAIMTALTGIRTASQNFTAFKDQLFTGAGIITKPGTPAFTFPDPVAAPLFAGVFTLAGTVGTQIKDALHYSVADGEDMGLEGAVATPVAAGTDQPDFSKSHIGTGGHPELRWIRGSHTATRILVDRGDGKGEVLLTISTLSHYTDTVLPAAGATASYTYRGIFLVGDEEYGQWSQPFQITVRG